MGALLRRRGEVRAPVPAGAPREVGEKSSSGPDAQRGQHQPDAQGREADGDELLSASGNECRHHEADHRDEQDREPDEQGYGAGGGTGVTAAVASCASATRALWARVSAETAASRSAWFCGV